MTHLPQLTNKLVAFILENHHIVHDAATSHDTSLRTASKAALKRSVATLVFAHTENPQPKPGP